MRTLSLICNYFNVGFSIVALLGLFLISSETGVFSFPGLMVVILMTVTAIVNLIFIYNNKPIDIEKEFMKKELENLKNQHSEMKS